MSTVLIHATMSLDGFIAGPDDEVDWSLQFGSDEMAAHSMQEIGAVVMGNSGFREGRMNEAAIPYGGAVKGPHFVVAHAPGTPVTIGGVTFTFINGIQQAVERAVAAAGEKSVALLGASICQQCLGFGLVDEIMIHLAPIILGDGIRLFDRLRSGRIALERTQLVSTAQITSVRFRVAKQSGVGS